MNRRNLYYNHIQVSFVNLFVVLDNDLCRGVKSGLRVQERISIVIITKGLFSFIRDKLMMCFVMDYQDETWFETCCDERDPITPSSHPLVM